MGRVANEHMNELMNNLTLTKRVRSHTFVAGGSVCESERDISVGNVDSVALDALAGFDYVALGPIFGTATKENPDATVGLDELRRLRPLTRRSLAAIGGITRATAPQVIAAGADSVAIIADLFPEDGNLRRRTAEWVSLLR